MPNTTKRNTTPTTEPTPIRPYIPAEWVKRWLDGETTHECATGAAQGTISLQSRREALRESREKQPPAPLSANAS